MARDVEANVNINDRSDKGLRGFLARLKGADDAAKQLQKDLDKAGQATGRFGKSTQENGKALQKLHGEIGIAKNELGGLARAFANAGSEAERIDISKAMRKTQTEIRNLTKNADVLKALVPDPATFAPIAVSLKSVLIAGAVAAAPFVAGAASAALIGGAAGAGILGGVLLASSDARVKQAGTNLGKTLLGGLREDAAVFIAPVLDAITMVGGRFELLRPKIRSIFADSAKFLAPLTDGALDALDGLLGGIQALVANAGPVVDALSGSLRILGDAAGESFKVIAGGSDDAAKSLTALTYVVAGSLVATGYLIRGLTEVGGAIIDFTQNKVEAWKKGLGLAGDASEDAAKKALQMAPVAGVVAASIDSLGLKTAYGVVAFDQYGQAIQTSGSALQSFNERLNDTYNASKNIFDSATNVGAAVDRMREAIDKNGKSLSVNSAKGRENRDALSGLVGVLNDNYQAAVAVNGEGVKSNGVLKSNEASFLRATAGMFKSKEAALAYGRSIGLIPPKKDTKINANTHDAEARLKAVQAKIAATKGKSITISALDAASAKARAIQAQINAMHGKTIPITVRVTRKGETLYGNQAPQGAAGGTFSLANGGGVSRSAPPTPVELTSETSVQVNLDGSPVRRIVGVAVSRATYRQKVGRR